MGEALGCAVAITFRFTSPQAAMESSFTSVKALMVGLICDFKIPCNCMVCRVVILIVPVECSPAI